MLQEVRREMGTFVENTSVKGIARTVRAKSRVVRACWIAFLFLCLGLLLLQVVTVLVHYYSNAVIRNTAVVQTSPNFPDVTICNLFPVGDRSRDFDSRYGAYVQKLDVLRDTATAQFNAANDRFWYFMRSLVAYNVNAMGPTVRAAGPDDADDAGFVVECRENRWDLYNGVDCPREAVTDRPLQRCVHIRPNNSDVALVKAIVFVDDFWDSDVDAFYSWTRMPMSSGVRVMVHPSGTKPDSRTSIYVAPGTDLVINVRQTNVTRLSGPVGNCTQQTSVYLDSDLDKTVGYNQATCVSLCRQQQTNDACHCIDTFELFSEAQLRAANRTFCLNVTQFLDGMSFRNSDEANRTLLDALWTIVKCYWYFVPAEENCDCPVRCSEVSYDYTVSASRWPSAIYQRSFYEQYLSKDSAYANKFAAYGQLEGPDLLQKVRSLRLIEENFLQVTVKMSERSVTTVTDMLAMSWDTMASNLGGCLNLWLGISVLTAAEFIELFYSLIRVIMRNNRTDDQDREGGRVGVNGYARKAMEAP